MPAVNAYLLAGAALSALAALLHVGCIVFGASWYRAFGAGEKMAAMAAEGHWFPPAITLGVASLLSLWSAYALSGAGLIGRLPLLPLALCLITGAYLVRGLAFPLLKAHFPGNSETFWWLSSAVCLVIGLVHLVGLLQVWPRL